MWILDSWCGAGEVGFCDLGQGARIHREGYAPPFYLAFPDPDRHWELVEGLSSRFRVGECTFTTIFGPVDGYAVHAGRDIARAIEEQSGQDAQLYNVDVGCDQRWMAEHRVVPCLLPGDSRFSPEVTHDLRVIGLAVHGNPSRPSDISSIEVTCEGRQEMIGGAEGVVLSDLGSLIGAIDPDVILFTDADLRVPALVGRAGELGIDLPLSRTGKYSHLAATSYWSYGKVHHRGKALLPQGRLLIDTAQSFVYNEGGLPGILLGARLTGLPPNFVARHTPGTLVSAYEAYEAVGRGIVVPLRKKDPEGARACGELRAMDRGGMMFQPEPGVYWDVTEIDFTSLYPSIIVKQNLSPETVLCPERTGFLAAALSPLLDLRVTTKALKKGDSRYDGIDTVLKWLLVVSFGYTGFKNARFGSIQVHEKITFHAREALVTAKELAEAAGFTVIHGIVDSLWIRGGREPVSVLQDRVLQVTGIPIETERFGWIAFLSQNDGSGAFTQYFGRLNTGKIKVRGIATRRHDTPPYIRAMQERILALIQDAETPEKLRALQGAAADVYSDALRGLSRAPLSELAIRKRVSRVMYRHACLEGSAVAAYRRSGIDIAPGMTISYVVRDAGRHVVDIPWEAVNADLHYYRGLMEKAWGEIAFVFEPAAHREILCRCPQSTLATACTPQFWYDG